MTTPPLVFPGMPGDRPEPTMEHPVLTRTPRAKRRMRHPRRNRAGSFMTDAMFALMIIIPIVIAAVTLYNGQRDAQRSNELQIQLVRAVAVIERFHSYSGIYANGSLVGFLDGEGFSDQQLARDGNSAWVFTSPFDTDISIVGSGDRDFTVTVNDLPASACKSVALAFRDSGAGLDSLTIETTNISLPMAESAVDTACDNTTNDVALTF
ncbi:type 4 pilus major pilin [uncultured Ruegeria sp.]|uniref:type 4 pilus major pilin n=1 Tax=uncultured Ruegeria sp. TaxID=259304 RepID=UPI00261C6E64|nr:type 4 pilus major pilin [uncultured Ruegeria sp.]